MEQRLRSQSARMAIYADPSLLSQARQCIPIDRLTAAARAGGTKPASPGPTKWLDFNKQPLEFQLSAPQAIGGWAFTTANDEPGRDPIRWVLEGKAAGGGDGWTAIHSQMLAPSLHVPSGRHTSTPTFGCSPAGPFASLRWRILATRDGAANCTQVEEVRFFSGGVLVVPTACTNPGGNSPGSEAAANVIPTMPTPAADEAGGVAAPEMGDAMEHDEFRMLLLKELMRWFKTEFFTWVNALSCSRCGGESEARGMLQPTAEELRWEAPRVEAHHCKTCGCVSRFPRYNSPAKLLETRRGRCGEWANCFTLCVTALGYDARYVLDFTDHVWVEAYVEQLGKYVHLDCCENAFDSPLMYEQGWCKKLTYVFSFGLDGNVVDSIWRYSKSFDETCTRRDQCSEETLCCTVSRVNDRLSIAPARLHELNLRYCVELVGFLSIPKNLRPEERQGRMTGSLAWRTERGETGQRGPA